MNNTWKLLQKQLENHKIDLINELTNNLVADDNLQKKSYGSCGHLNNMPGMFYINCSRKGVPCAFTGRGINDKSHYYWIPIVYKNDNCYNSYVISLVKEDLDIQTGNIHHNFSEIQIVKNHYESFEIGGAYNPAPHKEGSSYLVYHNYKYSFPSIVKSESLNKPWGYEISKIPSLDLKDENYSAHKVAEFVWELILKDLEH